MPANEINILYVEDNPENQLLVQRILRVEGYTVHDAASAQEAMAYLEHTVPDLILMDINLPEIDGYTLTKKIKQNLNLESTPIIALTANVMHGDRERILQSGCDGYIQKPINVDLLPEQIASYLKGG